MLVPKTTSGLPAGADPGSPSAGRSTAETRYRLGPRRRQAAPRTTRTVFALAALGLAPLSAAAQPTLPYTPTTILLPSNGNSTGTTAYIFAPSGDDFKAVDFLSLNITKLSGSSTPTPLTSSLPFLASDAGNCTTFSSSLLHNGTIAVFAGDCATGSTSSLWTYTPSAQTPSWTRQALTTSTTWDNAQSGPYHLGGMLSFSAQLSPTLSPPTLYLYGGMCPSSTSSTSNTNWQSSASYSNRMLRLTPPSSTTSPYTLSYSLPTGQQPPVAEAGFTLTQLTPSLSTRGTTITQQTTHVLLGGHTQNAFVNMSTAALWSLPEETWSFVGISPPTSQVGKGAGDLARQTATAVDSRSGHSAVLSEDGTRVVVFGGWVGDVGTPAAPQLAVVKVGVGLGDWVWEVPEQREESGGGVFGHGAVVLPGNVMMVYGGWEIESGSGVKRRAAGGKMFYNITGGSWSDEYVSPLAGGASTSGGTGTGSGSSGTGSTGTGSGGTVYGGSGSGSGSSSGSAGDSGSSDDSSQKRKIGLGVGLGVGLVVLAALAVLGARWFRRRRQRRAERDETIRGLAQGVNGSLPRGLGEDRQMLERDHGLGMFPWTAAAAREWYTGGDDPYEQGRRSLGYETLRGGSRSAPSLYIPPPPSASSFSSRPRNAKGLYQPAATGAYDFAPLTGAANRIDPIYEADEDEDGDLGASHPLSPDKDGVDDDPFLTPTLTTPVTALFPRNNAPSTPPPASTSANTGQQQHADVQGWVTSVDSTTTAAAGASRRHHLPQPPTPTTPTATGGRVSPLRRGTSTRSGRHSLVSAPTDSSSSSSGAASFITDPDNNSRTGSNLSERSAFSFARSVGGATSSNAATAAAAAAGVSDNGPPGTEDLALLSRLRTTLATTAERGGSSDSNSGNSYNTARTSNLNFTALQAEGPSLLLGNANNPSGSIGVWTGDDEGDEPGSPSKHKPRRSWFGSLRRVFSGGTPESSRGSLGRHGSSREGSPTREGLLLYEGGSADYDGGMYGGGGGIGGLQRRRQGREAWLGGEGGGGDEEEWERDLERAAERRTVQIMFTVPREQLRVVNAEVEREESVLIVDPDDEEEGGGGDDADEAAEPEEQHGPEPGLLPPLMPRPADEGKGKAVDMSGATLEPPAGVSPSPSLRASSFTTGTLHTAEAVRLERPKTRVLAMVESLESLSREGSPAGSPERSPERRSERGL